jgi:hypothetical protein
VVLEVLGLEVLSPSYELSGEPLERDMGELVPSPVGVKAAIIGVGPDDHVLELIEYPRTDAGGGPPDGPDIGLTHVGLVCDDIEGTRADLERRGWSS